MIERPPKIEDADLFKAYIHLSKEEYGAVSALVEKINERYDFWSDVKYEKPSIPISPQELWAFVKASRMKNRMLVWPQYGIHMSVTNHMQRICHEFDMNFGGSWGTSSLIPEGNKNQYLISSLMEEAISSSQMEGASTTRKVAKEMLRKKITPKDKSQQMIFNNYQTIHFIVENKDKPLTEEMLLRIHGLMTEGTLDRPEDAGRFRSNDDVVVEDGITHEIVHTPPSYRDIPDFITDLCDFFNEEKAKVFIHPIIRGIIIHFMLAYMHPFVDGNGRTARALFYWYMLKRGYWLTEYLSISRIIARSKKAYEKCADTWIKEDLPVVMETMSKEEAVKSGAEAMFIEKYADIVNVYKIGDVSKEICGGPHVEHTGVLGHFKITKEEASSAGVRRIKAILE